MSARHATPCTEGPHPLMTHHPTVPQRPRAVALSADHTTDPTPKETSA